MLSLTAQMVEFTVNKFVTFLSESIISILQVL